jgi:hypothetical protein
MLCLTYLFLSFDPHGSIHTFSAKDYGLQTVFLAFACNLASNHSTTINDLLTMSIIM